MSSAKRKPNYIFSVSWEVCNKIGGIYTVLSTQAKTLKEESGATLIYVGPDLWEGKNNPLFIEDKGCPFPYIRTDGSRHHRSLIFLHLACPAISVNA